MSYFKFLQFFCIRYGILLPKDEKEPIFELFKSLKEKLNKEQWKSIQEILDDNARLIGKSLLEAPMTFYDVHNRHVNRLIELGYTVEEAKQSLPDYLQFPEQEISNSSSLSVEEEKEGSSTGSSLTQKKLSEGFPSLKILARRAVENWRKEEKISEESFNQLPEELKNNPALSDKVIRPSNKLTRFLRGQLEELVMSALSENENGTFLDNQFLSYLTAYG